MRSNVSMMVKMYSCGYPWDLGIKSICYETLLFLFNYKHSDGGTGGGCSVVLVVSPLASQMAKKKELEAISSEDNGTSNSMPMRLAQPYFYPLAVKFPNECFDCVSVRQRRQILQWKPSQHKHSCHAASRII